MIADTTIKGARTLLPGGWSRGDLSFSDRIAPSGPPHECVSIDARGRRLTPGLVDLHAHGIGHFAFERSVDDLRQGLRLVAAFGVTSILPTLYRVLRPESFSLIADLAAVLDEPGGARAPGFHFEGPFLAIAGAGAFTIAGDMKLLDDLLDAAGGRVAAMSVSPEVKNILPVIERLRERNVTVFMTHTRASPEQTQAAIDAGARHATHFYDVFPVPEELEPGARPVGAVEVILGDPRVSVDFICDGVHVHPAAVRMALAAKGRDGVVAITDANVGAGLPPGEYQTPWDYRIVTRDGDAARVADVGHPLRGTLAGSALTMDRAVANLSRWLGDDVSPWRMATSSAARVVGLGDRGVLEPGALADLVLWDDDDRPAATWVAGRLVYQRHSIV